MYVRLDVLLGHLLSFTVFRLGFCIFSMISLAIAQKTFLEMTKSVYSPVTCNRCRAAGFKLALVTVLILERASLADRALHAEHYLFVREYCARGIFSGNIPFEGYNIRANFPC